MGEVYEAFDTRLNRPVAVKILSDELADAPARHRFQREAKMASSLNHPHILTVYDEGDLEGRQYLVTEYIDGGTLRDWAKSGKRTWPEIVELLIGVVIETRGVSGKWLLAYVRYAPPGQETTGAIVTFPLEGGTGVYLFKIGGRHPVAWSADRRTLYLSLSAEPSSHTYAVPRAPGRDWPEIAKTGFQAADLAKLPGVRVIDAPEVAPGPTSEVYASSRETIQRNLYRIPVP